MRFPLRVIAQSMTARDDEAMAVQLNRAALAYARRLIDEGRFIADRRTDWSEDRPSARMENEFIKAHGWAEYALWHLGINDEGTENTKGRFKFPYGDFDYVHRCALISAESRAGQYKHFDIEAATIELRELIDAPKK